MGIFDLEKEIISVIDNIEKGDIEKSITDLNILLKNYEPNMSEKDFKSIKTKFLKPVKKLSRLKSINNNIESLESKLSIFYKRLDISS